MSPAEFLSRIQDPAAAFLAGIAPQTVSPESRLLLCAIAGQESSWRFRGQFPVGYAHGFYECEKGGAVAAGCLREPVASWVRAVCAWFSIEPTVDTVFEAVAFHDTLAYTVARGALWLNPKPLPAVGEQDAAWDYYNSTWRPGRPRPSDWPKNYQAALAAVTAQGTT